MSLRFMCLILGTECYRTIHRSARSNIAVFNEHLWHKCALSMPVYACRCGIVVVLCTCLQNYTDRLVNIHGVAK